MKRSLGALLACMASRPDLFQPNEPALEADLLAAEEVLARPIPESLKVIYRCLNGYGSADGNLDVYPLHGGTKLSLVSTTATYREWEWPVPDEVLLFGANGSGEPYGLWTGPHDSERFPSPVIQIEEIFEPDCMRIVSATVEDLLIDDVVWTLLFEGAQAEAAAAFEIPEADLPDRQVIKALLEGAPEGSELAARAANETRRLERRLHPRLDPDLHDSYAARLDADGVARALA